MRGRTAFRTLAALCLAALLVAACSDDDPDAATDATPAPGAGEFPVTVRAANGDVRLETRPERIVSLSPTATEMLFAIGAGEQVVAADEFSNYPPESPTTDLSGFQPNVEAIASYEPDLVVMQDDQIADALGAIDVPLLVAPAAIELDDAYEQVEQLGMATGHDDEAGAVIEGMRSAVAELQSLVRDGATEPVTYYYELDAEYYSVTSQTFIGGLFASVGYESIADAVDDGTTGGYPQLSAEHILGSDPDVIFLADTKCCAQTAETVAARPGWSEMSAVQSGRIVELDDDIASRWGPRVVELLGEIVAAHPLFAEAAAS